MSLLVAVSKADLLSLGNRYLGLSKLGEEDRLHRGVARYLEHLAVQCGVGIVTGAEPAARDLLGGYLGAGGELSVIRSRCAQLAAAIVAHYDRPDALWSLVHRGHNDVIEVPGDGRGQLLRYQLALPSIEDHLQVGLRRGNATAMQIRDIVMSSLGCGVMFALGFSGPVELLLQRTERHGEIRFFLCSPLSSVPRVRRGTQHQIELLEGNGTFPLLSERSAALTQLRLASLWKAL
jgi:hypothetical protein